MLGVSKFYRRHVDGIKMILAVRFICGFYCTENPTKVKAVIGKLYCVLTYLLFLEKSFEFVRTHLTSNYSAVLTDISFMVSITETSMHYIMAFATNGENFYDFYYKLIEVQSRNGWILYPKSEVPISLTILFILLSSKFYVNYKMCTLDFLNDFCKTFGYVNWVLGGSLYLMTWMSFLVKIIKLELFYYHIRSMKYMFRRCIRSGHNVDINGKLKHCLSVLNSSMDVLNGTILYLPSRIMVNILFYKHKLKRLYYGVFLHRGKLSVE